MDIPKWLVPNGIGDVASIAGVIISIIGFVITIIATIRSKDAASRAEAASEAVRKNIRFLDSVVDFSTVIAQLEEIKRLHRQHAWSILLDRYATLRKVLISLRGQLVTLTSEQHAVIQSAITNLSQIEQRVERDLAAKLEINVAKVNLTISADIDKLTLLLGRLKSDQGGSNVQ